MDKIDEKLIALLEQDARQGSTKLAKQLKVSPATVRRRIRELLDNETMRIAAVVDHGKVGYPLSAIISLHVEHDKIDSVIHLLFDRPEIVWISSTTGRFDIILVARFRDTSDLSNFIQKELPHFKGVRDSETFVCLQVLNVRRQPRNQVTKEKNL